LISNEFRIITQKEVVFLNIGLFDRVLRLFAGLGVVLFDYIANSTWEFIFLVIGVWSVTTSVFGWCPFYKVFGMNTCPASFKLKHETNHTE
tara:strand:+ start:3259 stop:3531 length:273 start_codon:yes stop_codon:yes gene_type:complete